MIEPLNYYLKNASKLADPKRTNYLVFITNGNDNCFGSLFASKADKLLAYEKLAIELGKLNIRVMPIGFDAASGADDSGVIVRATVNATPTSTCCRPCSSTAEAGSPRCPRPTTRASSQR